MFDLVPLAGTWRKMTHEEFQLQFVSQLLQRHFPESRTSSVAATAIGGNQQLARPWKAALPHFAPPATDTVGCELRCVVVNAHADPALADPALVVKKVIHAIGNGLTQFLVQEVVDTHIFRRRLWPPFPSPIAKIPD